MMARSHIVIGAAAWIVFSKITNISTSISASVTFTIISAVSALLPDMDHPKSVFGQMIKPVSIVISKLFGHRGITHSLFAIALLAFCLYKYGGNDHMLISAMSVGYLSHLIADFMTPAGVPLLYPIKMKFRSPVTVSTNGLGETLIVIMIFLYIIFSSFIFINGNFFDVDKFILLLDFKQYK